MIALAGCALIGLLVGSKYADEESAMTTGMRAANIAKATLKALKDGE